MNVPRALPVRPHDEFPPKLKIKSSLCQQDEVPGGNAFGDRRRRGEIMGLHCPWPFQDGSLSGTLVRRASSIEQSSVELPQGRPMQVVGA